tara:strand:+ start:2810 stop:4021 length:1212 start_codon:yes stop_codon:yes gene_type:complete
MKKLFIFMNTNPTNRYFYEKNIKDVKKCNKWQVQFWNLLKIENKKLNDIYVKKKGNRIIKDKNIINIESVFSLKKQFDKLPPAFFYFNGAAKTYKALLIDRLLHIYGGKKVYIEDNGKLTGARSFKENFSFVLKYFDKFALEKIIKYPIILLNKFIKFKVILPTTNIFFVPNKVLYKVTAEKEGVSKIKKIHDYDYERFMKLNKFKKRKKFIVFIDQAMDSGFERKMLRGASLIADTAESKKYWNKIEQFLLYIKAEYGMSPVVAGAQRRNIYDLPLKNNKFFFDRTVELIKDSKFVITHDSTAIHFAILFKKPIILLTMDEFFRKKHATYLTINELSKELGAKIVNLDKFSYSRKNFNLNTFLKINQNKYKKYINKYLKFNNSMKNGTRWQIILNELDKINL